MKTTFQKSFIQVLKKIVILSAVFSMLQIQPAAALVQNWQKGLSLYPEMNNDFATQKFQTSLWNAKNMGANTATFIIPLYQTYYTSADIQKGWNTPTDQSLVAGIKNAKALGMQVALKIHLSTYYGDAWAAKINPKDKDLWFSNYGKILDKYSKLAQTYGVAQFCIGNELTALSSEKVDPKNTSHWQKLIAQVRKQYKGKVFYNANWGEEKEEITFWQSLDFIGLSAYFTLSQDLLASWDYWNKGNIAPLYEKYKKPILFSEIGYRSIKDARYAPWNFAVKPAYDAEEQAEAYEALFEYWNKHSYMVGLNIWNWETDPSAGGLGNVHYTIQNKPAEQIVGKWFKK